MCLGLSILKEVIIVFCFEPTIISGAVVHKVIAHNDSKLTHYENVLDKQSMSVACLVSFHAIWYFPRSLVSTCTGLLIISLTLLANSWHSW